MIWARTLTDSSKGDSFSEKRFAEYLKIPNADPEKFTENLGPQLMVKRRIDALPIGPPGGESIAKKCRICNTSDGIGDGNDLYAIKIIIL